MEFFTWMSWKTKAGMIFMFVMLFWCVFKMITHLMVGSPWFLYWVCLTYIYLNFFYERSLDWKSFKLRMVEEPEKKIHTFYL